MSRQNILRIAAAELGNVESPAGSNRTKYGEWYGLNGVPWCAIFVSWVYEQAGCPLGRIEGIRGYQSCEGGYRFWKAKARVIRDPQPGDIVIYDWKGDGHADHTGIFDSWVSPGQSFKAYEGNTAVGDDSNGGCVMLRTRNLGSVKAFICPLNLDSADMPAGAPQTAAQPQAPGGTTTGSVYLKKGSSGAAVLALQRALNAKAGAGTVSEDGVFGKATAAALMRFQQGNGLEADGVAGPQTFAKLGMQQA